MNSASLPFDWVFAHALQVLHCLDHATNRQVAVKIIRNRERFYRQACDLLHSSQLHSPASPTLFPLLFMCAAPFTSKHISMLQSHVEIGILKSLRSEVGVSLPSPPPATQPSKHSSG